MIKKTSEYNQGIGKFKLLSSTAGVGSLVTTKQGYSILISDIDKWPFFTVAKNTILEVERYHGDKSPDEKFQIIKEKLSGRDEITPGEGIEIVEDLRFIEFLCEEKKLPKLSILIAIPHLGLDERSNRIKETDNPVLKRTGKKGEDFIIPSSHFPKWFYNAKGYLKPLSKWFQEWKDNRQLQAQYFAPPRDIGDKKGKFRDFKEEKPLFRELSQTNLVLICPNGHLSDIPWANYLELKDRQKKTPNEDLKSGKFLFSRDFTGEDCDHSELKWTENKTKLRGVFQHFY